MASLTQYVASLAELLANHELSVLAEKEIPYGRQLAISDGATKITVNIYSGKKGISVTVGGSAASPLKAMIQAIVDGRSAVMPAQSPGEGGNPPGFENVPNFDNRWIGTDESGKGDFFGPLIIGAVMVDKEIADKLIMFGIKDSKLLSDDKAKAFATRIREICQGRYVQVEITPTKYNYLYDQFTAEGKNLNHLLAWGHARALEELLSKAPCRFALADKFANEKLIQSRLFAKGKDITLVQATKAEKNVAVAAASILARDRFLHGLSELESLYGIKFPKGASPAVIAAAKEFVQKNGRGGLAKVAKIHFKTTEKI